MTSYSHNTLNQLTAIGGSGGVKTVIVRGNTDQPAAVKVKPGTSSTWKNARMLSGNRFESDLDLATGPNSINVQATGDANGQVSNYTYALNLAAASAATPTHDADGNLLSDGVRSYQWDSQSRLTKITWGDGTNKTTDFKYNPLGQRSERIEKTGTSETAHFYYLYEGIHLVNRYSGGTDEYDNPIVGAIDRRYFSQGEQRNNGASWDSHYYTRDHLGSIREVVNSDGSLAARYDYDPYGRRLTQYQSASYADGCDLGFTGHITQQSPVPGQTELVLTLFRAYDPDLGRWLSADPIGEAGGMNLYGYVRGSPLAHGDRLGLCDTWAGLEGELTSPFGGIAFGIGSVIDHQQPEESGIAFTIGWGFGWSAGVSTGIQYWENEMEGTTNEIDVNWGPVSIALPTPEDTFPFASDCDFEGISATVGPGAGVSINQTTTYTLSAALIEEGVNKVVWWVEDKLKSIFGNY